MPGGGEHRRTARAEGGRRPYDELLAAGMIRAAIEDGDPLEDWPDIRLPRGTAAALIDSDRCRGEL